MLQQVVSPPAASVIETPITISTPAPTPPTPPVANITSSAAEDSPVKYPTSSSPAKTSQSCSKEVSTKEAYAEPEVLNQFVQDVERLEKVVEGLTNKTLNGPTPLDLKWKELQELQVCKYSIFNPYFLEYNL
jgi:tyrosine-protein phosphatase non-receptor type 23